MMIIPNRGRVVAVISALALAGGLLTLVLLAKPTQAQPPTDNENRGATSEQFPTDFVLAPDCFGEEIEVTGTVHVVNQFVPVQGGYHLTSTFNLMNMKGVGLTTGDQYVVNAQGENIVDNFLPTGDDVSGSVTIGMVVSKGSSPNQNYQAVLRYIINEDGTVKLEVRPDHIECTGPGGPTFPTASASASAAATPAATLKAQSRP